MIKRSSILVLLWTLVLASVPAQQRGAGAAEPTAGHRVTGVLISPSGRVAVVNDTLSREGDRVDGAEIVSIVVGAVRMRMGSREATVFVGSNAVWEDSSRPSAEVSRRPMQRQSLSGSIRPAGSGSFQAATLARFDEGELHGPVQRGETLSGIAQRYLIDGMSMDQMMIAVFQANPQAFSGNINVLYEGALLRIPDENSVHRQPPAAAAAEVARQQIHWRNGSERAVRLAKVSDREMYGPVSSGETLSGIAEGMLRHGVTRNQVMIALFDANPQAFSGNINVLYKGAILRIPDGEELRSQAPETASAEVVRHTDSWLSGAWRQARSTTAPAPHGTEEGMHSSGHRETLASYSRAPVYGSTRLEDSWSLPSIRETYALN
jgi:FimV-like protein